MAGYLLHQGATVMCQHTGHAHPTQVSTRVTVNNGQAIITQSSIYTITACQFPSMTSGAPPCVTAQWLSVATRVRSNGQFVLLQDSQALCTPNGTPLQVLSTQTRVKAV